MFPSESISGNETIGNGEMMVSSREPVAVFEWIENSKFFIDFNDKISYIVHRLKK
jgi:hypothetical protein